MTCRAVQKVHRKHSRKRSGETLICKVKRPNKSVSFVTEVTSLEKCVNLAKVRS